MPNSLNSHNGAGRTVLSPPASSSVDYCWNRRALRWRLKEHRVVSGVLRSAGRLFHVRGPLMAKLRWPVAVRARGTSCRVHHQNHPVWQMSDFFALSCCLYYALLMMDIPTMFEVEKTPVPAEFWRSCHQIVTWPIVTLTSDLFDLGIPVYINCKHVYII